MPDIEFAAIKSQLGRWVLAARRGLMQLQADQYRYEDVIRKSDPKLYAILIGTEATPNLFDATSRLLARLLPYEAGGYNRHADQCISCSGTWAVLAKRAIVHHAPALHAAGVLRQLVSCYEVVDRIHSTLTSLIGTTLESECGA